MFEAADEVVFREYEEAEMHTPYARKADAEGRTIYASRELERPRILVHRCFVTLARSCLVLKNAWKTSNLTSTFHQKSYWKFLGLIASISGTWVAW
jgi:hypothetical protein